MTDTDGKFGFTPSIRESILTHQSDIKKKLTSAARVTFVALAVCGLFLAANFALTITAVVSNKDVYVSGARGLVDSAGERLSMDVSKQEASVHDLPYEHASTIAAVDHITIRRGNNTHIFFPATFMFQQDAEGHFELKMKTLDGVMLKWGPPSQFASDGRLMVPLSKKTITITDAQGTTVVGETAMDGRLLQGGDDKVVVTGQDFSNFRGDIDGHCAASISAAYHQAEGEHLAIISGSAPSAQWGGAGPYPLFVWLIGTGMHPLTSTNGVASTMTSQMSDRGFVGVAIEYPNGGYPDSCPAFETKATMLATCINNLCASTAYLACSKGIATAGWSQGGQEALLMPKFVNFKRWRSTAVLSFDGTIMNFNGRQPIQRDCFGARNLGYPDTYIRILIHENDAAMGRTDNAFDQSQYGGGDPDLIIANNEIILGWDTGRRKYTCPSKNNCIQPQGYGYYLVSNDECGCICDFAHPCGHFWFILTWQEIDGMWEPETMISQLYDDELEYGMKKSFDWLASQAQTMGLFGK